MHHAVHVKSQPAGLRLTAITDAAELKSAAGFSERLDVIEPLLVRWAKVSSVPTRNQSELDLDDRFTAWRHLSHTVSAGLNLATDNLRAVRQLVRPDGTLKFPQFAHYALLRAALEGGSLALWLLAPDDPRERIQRLLRAAAAELQDEVSLSNRALDGYLADPDIPEDWALIDRSRKQMKAHKRKHAGQIRDVAKSLGLRDPTSDRWAVGYAEIVAESTAHVGLKGYYGEVTWRIISGLTHPSLTRAATRSNIEELARSDNGTLDVIVTTDIGLSRTALEAALLSVHAAIELWGLRKIKPADPAQYRPAPSRIV